jgi:serine/threonine protein kinase
MEGHTSSMTAERWMQLKQIFEAAQGKPASEQAEIVRALAQGDEELRLAAQDLLAADQSAGSFLQTPPAQLQNPLLAPGAKLGPYQILGLLGEGGMGKVYRGLDTRLGRAVAIKISAQQFSQRFELEARAISALNHPNICTLYDVGPNYLVTELIEGETLREWLQHTPALERRLETIRQVLEALRAAHTAGIVHRDLKPQNIMVRFDGYVKVLDFGLAKQMLAARSPQVENAAAMEATVPGQIIGTVAYMSPEQIQGHPVDQRSDLFAIGIILFEMLTGQHPWPRKSMVDTLHAIVHDDPPPLPSPLDEKLGPILRKLLAKNPAERYSLAEGVLDALASSVTLPAPSAGISADRQPPPRFKRPNNRRPIPWIAALVILLLVLAAAGAYLFISRGRKVLTANDTVVIADFANATGDPVFDGTLRQGLSIQLEQSPFLNIISDQKIQQTLQMMGQKPDAKLTPEIARELCQRAGGSAALDGSIAQIGTNYLLTVKAINCVNGETLASTEAQASDKNHVLDALGKTATQMRNQLGESLVTVKKFDTPLEEATTPSLEALKAFSSALQVINTTSTAAAIPFFNHAIELDPNFALAYAYLGIMENDLVEPVLAVEYFRKAYELRDRTSEAEKYSIAATYHKSVTGNITKAIEACRLWIQAYPRAYHPHDLLGGAILPVIGEYEQAIDEANQAMRLSPDFPVPYYQRMFSELALNRVDEAQATYALARSRKLNNPFYNFALYEIAFLRNDRAGMAQQLAKTKGLSGFEDQLLALEADTAAYSGRLRDARDLTRRAMDSAEQAGEKDTPAMYSATSGLREAWYGNSEEAIRRVDLAMKRPPNRDLLYFAALVWAYSGQDAKAQALARDLDKQFPEDTLVQFNYLPTLRAKLALNKGMAAEAVDNLRVAAKYELGVSTNCPPNWTAMYPVYVRGEAYLAARQGREAAAEFQKLLDHSGLVLNQPIGALAHLGLARARLLQGDTVQAKRAYGDFLALWKDADPDIPVLKQAKAEYAKLP